MENVSKENSNEKNNIIKPVFHICATCCKGPASSFNNMNIPGRPNCFKDLFLQAPLQKCSNCNQGYFCSQICQQKGWDLHKVSCKGKQGKVACLVTKSGYAMEQVWLDPNDPIFDKATISPAMALCDIPLCLIELEKGENNQWCTFLMIDPISGYAPPQWSMLGTVLICRKDRMPITATHFCHLGDFMSHILDQFGGTNDKEIHKTMMTKGAFMKYILAQGAKSVGISW